MSGGAFTIDTHELERAGRALAEFEPGPTLARTLDDMAEASRDAIRARASRHSRTGRMVRQVDIYSDGHDEHRVDRVHAGGKPARLIVGGTRSHVIRPRHRHALELSNATGRVLGFATSVHHPGMRPDPFVAAGIDDAQAERSRAADRAADRLADELASEIGG